MTRMHLGLSVLLLLTGCPFTPEDLELTAGSPSLGAGGAAGPGGPRGGPMSEPDLNALVPAQTQDEVRSGEHRILQGTVEGDCGVSVRIDVLQGPPAPGDLGGPAKKKAPKETDASPDAALAASGTDTTDDQGGPNPRDGLAAHEDPHREAGLPPANSAGAAAPEKPGPSGSGPGGPPQGETLGPITTLRIDGPGPFAIAAPTDRSLRVVALCDGNEDGYLTHSDDRISPPLDLGVPEGGMDGLVLALAEPQMPTGGGPGGPPAGGPGGPPAGGPGGPPTGGPGGPPAGGPGGPPAGGPGGPPAGGPGGPPAGGPDGPPAAP